MNSQRFAGLKERACDIDQPGTSFLPGSSASNCGSCKAAARTRCQPMCATSASLCLIRPAGPFWRCPMIVNFLIAAVGTSCVIDSEALIPSTPPGMLMSINTMCGWYCLASLMPSTPLAAAPTTSKSGSNDSSLRRFSACLASLTPCAPPCPRRSQSTP